MKWDKKGTALLFIFYFMIFLMAFSGMVVMRSVNESNMARKERSDIKAFYVADAGVQKALQKLDELINQNLKNTISLIGASGVISDAGQRVANGDGLGWLVYNVKDNNGIVQLTEMGNKVTYPHQQGTFTKNNYVYTYDISLTEKRDPFSISEDVWDFPFNYTLKTSGTVEGITKALIVTGDFTVRVQKDNFARYALFTNTQISETGSYVWFTNDTNFNGPLHTNGQFNFAGNPSGTFNNLIKQKDAKARFYNNGVSVLKDAASNGTRDVPKFKNGFQRNVSGVSLATTLQQTDMMNQASGGDSYSSNGIYLPVTGSALKGGIFIKGDAALELQVDSQNRAKYKIVQGSTTKMVTVDKVNHRTSVQSEGSSIVTTYNNEPNGIDHAGTIIYVDGKITSLKGTVQKDTALTVSSTNHMTISNHLTYSDFTPGVGSPGDANYQPPSAVGKNNILGLVCWQGNVSIGISAPNNVNVHATVLAKQGVFKVDNYDRVDYNNDGHSDGMRGTATVLGGVITNNYGAFGTFGGQTNTGYGRHFVYDARTENGVSPPYFPTLSSFVAFSNDIMDKLIWQEAAFY